MNEEGRGEENKLKREGQGKGPREEECVRAWRKVETTEGNESTRKRIEEMKGRDWEETRRQVVKRIEWNWKPCFYSLSLCASSHTALLQTWKRQWQPILKHNSLCSERVQLANVIGQKNSIAMLIISIKHSRAHCFGCCGSELVLLLLIFLFFCFIFYSRTIWWTSVSTLCVFKCRPTFGSAVRCLFKFYLWLWV